MQRVKTTSSAVTDEDFNNKHGTYRDKSGKDYCS